MLDSHWFAVDPIPERPPWSYALRQAWVTGNHLILVASFLTPISHIIYNNYIILYVYMFHYIYIIIIYTYHNISHDHIHCRRVKVKPWKFVVNHQLLQSIHYIPVEDMFSGGPMELGRAGERSSHPPFRPETQLIRQL